MLFCFLGFKFDVLKSTGNISGTHEKCVIETKLGRNHPQLWLPTLGCMRIMGGCGNDDGCVCGGGVKK